MGTRARYCAGAGKQALHDAERHPFSCGNAGSGLLADKSVYEYMDLAPDQVSPGRSQHAVGLVAAQLASAPTRHVCSKQRLAQLETAIAQSLKS